MSSTENSDLDRTLAFIERPADGLTASNGNAARSADDPGKVVRVDGAATADYARATTVTDRVVKRLIRDGAVKNAVVREASVEWMRHGEVDPLWRVLAKHPAVNAELVYAEAARTYAFRPVTIADADVFDFEFAKRVLEGFSDDQRDELLVHGLIPISYEFDQARGDLKLVFATHDPTHPELLRFIYSLDLSNFEVCYAKEEEIVPILEVLFPKRNEFLERISRDPTADAYDFGTDFGEQAREVVDEAAIDAEINRSALINLFEGALIEAVRIGASDIHIYPNAKKQTEFHFRIDGQLQLWKTQTKVSPEAMIAVVKDKCGNIDRFERERAQDGYIQRTIDGALIRYRVSVLPIATANRDIKAESVVVRVLDDRNVFNDLSQIGLLEGALKAYQRAVRLPHGMIIMTGPTGSGKSTTLVAALHQIIRPQINVLTVEDPVEYVIQGVRQIKLGSRLSLENAMRAILRHDPDVVMVGEMRDRETAELAIKLANTGHLTLSTLHTNDAPSAVSRLFKMGIEPFLLAYAINLIVAQRLLRKLCPECRVVEKDPDPVLLKEIGFSAEEIAATTFYRASVGARCQTCKGVGYKGRRAIAEALYLSREIRHMIVTAGEAIDEDAIKKMAVKQGMLTLVASAREVVKLGETTIEEVIRVTLSDE